MKNETRAVVVRLEPDGSVKVAPKSFAMPSWPFRIRVIEVPASVTDEEVAGQFARTKLQSPVAIISWHRLVQPKTP